LALGRCVPVYPNIGHSCGREIGATDSARICAARARRHSAAISDAASSCDQPGWLARLRPRCRRTSKRRRIGERVAAVGCVIGVAIAAPVVVVIEAETEARHDAPAAIEIPCVAEGTARLGKVLPRNAASESRAGAAEMAPAKATAHARANANAAHASATEPAYASATTEPTHMSAATEPTHVSAAEPAADVSAATKTSTVPATKTPTMSAPAARKRISGQSRGESGSRGQYDHDLT
jgi:hypothetical protein